MTCPKPPSNKKGIKEGKNKDKECDDINLKKCAVGRRCTAKCSLSCGHETNPISYWRQQASRKSVTGLNSA